MVPAVAKCERTYKIQKLGGEGIKFEVKEQVLCRVSTSINRCVWDGRILDSACPSLPRANLSPPLLRDISVTPHLVVPPRVWALERHFAILALVRIITGASTKMSPWFHVSFKDTHCRFICSFKEYGLQRDCLQRGQKTDLRRNVSWPPSDLVCLNSQVHTCSSGDPSEGAV